MRVGHHDRLGSDERSAARPVAGECEGTRIAAHEKRAFAKADKLWTANAKDIGDYLTAANPHWGKRTLANLLSLHLKLTKDSVVARLEKRWDDEVAAYDDILVEITTLADLLADGIVAQFPDKFA